MFLDWQAVRNFEVFMVVLLARSCGARLCCCGEIVGDE